MVSEKIMKNVNFENLAEFYFFIVLNNKYFVFVPFPRSFSFDTH